MSECSVVRVDPADIAELGSAAALRARLSAAVELRPYAEIWIEHGPFPALCALVNRQWGWLMLLRYEGDPGFSSRNPFGAQGAISYVLDNGQEDEYPAEWAYPTEAVLDVLVEFAYAKRLPELVHWHNDSGDGLTSPNDALSKQVDPK